MTGALKTFQKAILDKTFVSAGKSLGYAWTNTGFPAASMGLLYIVVYTVTETQVQKKIRKMRKFFEKRY